MQRGSCRRRAAAWGFTLIELLAVIAIVGILASLLLPVFSKAKSQAATVRCLNNLKQLQLCCHLYAVDNQDFLPPNNFVYDIMTLQPLDPDFSPTLTWCPGLTGYDTTTTNIENGLLFPYNRSVAIYHCPADRGMVQTTGGTRLNLLRTRSYSMSQSVNGRSLDPDDLSDLPPSFQKESEIDDPSPSNLFVFIEIHDEELIGDSHFGIPPGGTFDEHWFDLPTGRHHQGCDLSFADGHAERWKWAAPKLYKRLGQSAANKKDLADFRRVQAAVRSY